MKLLLCPDCGDIFNLKMYSKKCRCGKTYGYYRDQTSAVYRYGIPLGIINGSLKLAIRMVPEKDDNSRTGGERFEAFVVPGKCKTFTQLPDLEGQEN